MISNKTSSLIRVYTIFLRLYTIKDVVNYFLLCIVESLNKSTSFKRSHLKDGKMKIYLIIPNELLLSSFFIDRKVPKCKTKIIIGLDAFQLEEESSLNFSGEICEAKQFADYPERLSCDLNMSGKLATGASHLDIVGMKTTKPLKPMLSQQSRALCDQI